MFLGKLLILTAFLTSSTAMASKATNSFTVGAGYLMFTESLKVINGGVVEGGIANYSGLIFNGEHIWVKGRALYQAGVGVGVGKATAGPFSSYPDSSRRAWSLAFLDGSINYRIYPKISIGAGMIAGSRSADWKSEQVPSTTVKGLNKTVYAPELLFRWNVSRRISLVQSIATPDFRGTTMWRWTAQFKL